MSYQDDMAKKHQERRKVANPGYRMNMDLLNRTPDFLKKCPAHEMKRVYIAGAYTGREDYARGQFREAAERLRRNNPHMEWVNPLEDLGLSADNSWEECIATCVYVLLKCNRIHLLPGWEESRGAKIEAAVALKAGLMVTYEGTSAFIPHDFISPNLTKIQESNTLT
jgi:hypothetical protein